MLEKKLGAYFRRINQEQELTLNPSLKSAITDFIYEPNKVKNPYKFAHENKLDVVNTLQLLLYFTDGDNPPLLLQLYLDCQDLDCKSSIYLEEYHEGDIVTCDHCFNEYPKGELKRLTKVKFIKNDGFFVTKTPTSTYDVLEGSDRGLKLSPAISQQQNTATNNVETAGTSLITLSKLNTPTEEIVISKTLSEVEYHFSRSMEAFTLE